MFAIFCYTSRSIFSVTNVPLPQLSEPPACHYDSVKMTRKFFCYWLLTVLSCALLTQFPQTLNVIGLAVATLASHLSLLLLPFRREVFFSAVVTKIGGRRWARSTCCSSQHQTLSRRCQKPRSIHLPLIDQDASSSTPTKRGGSDSISVHPAPFHTL